MRNIILILQILLSSTLLLNAQQNNPNEKRWSSTSKLNESDFQMATDGPDHNPCFAQFSINYSVNGFDFMTKNFNQKVETVMYRGASWLNEDVSEKDRLLKFQQVLFDMSELYTRKFRKALLENRKSIAHGTGIVEEINEKIMIEFTKERARFEQESEGGINEEVVMEWSNRIFKQLDELELFSYEYTKKIKLE